MLDLDHARHLISDIDRDMARLFEKRMETARLLTAYKAEHGLPIEDLDREKELFRQNTACIENKEYLPYYARFFDTVLMQSKRLQHNEVGDLHVCGATGDYDVIVQCGGLHRVGEFFPLNRKVLVVTDSGVPEAYGMTVASQCEEAILFIFEQGEASKNMDTYRGIMQTLAAHHFTRSDCIVAVGGGVVGDVAGFAAATYMRGIDFYNVPSTVIAQADASVGGKTAINIAGIKNQIGAFYSPAGVLIDSNLLSTLPDRHIANGLAEIVKMALIGDAELFLLLEKGPTLTDEIIIRALQIKKRFVELDELDRGARKGLNFGHTLGHAIECVESDLLHGECVALGMLPMCAPAVRERLLPLLQRIGLPTHYRGNVSEVIEACRHDKKKEHDQIALIYVPGIGSYEIKYVSFDEYVALLREVLCA